MRARLLLTALAMGAIAVACSDDDDATGTANTVLQFTSQLTGEAERPTPVTTGASGNASFGATTGNSPFFDPLSAEPKSITYSITVTGLSGSAVEANIHGPADENSVAGIIVPLTITSPDTAGLIINGTFASTGNATVSVDSLLTLMRAGLTYVSVRTAANPAGETRGQIVLR